MKLYKIGISLAGAAWLAGCATQEARYPIHPPPPPPPPPAYVPPPPPPEPPPATLVGRMAASGRPGERWSCEGQSVVLLAAGPATDARMQGLYGSTTFAASPVEAVRRRAAAVTASAQAEPPVASATCSDQAGFTLTGLRGGTYFLIARAKLSAASGVTNYALMRRVQLRPGETAVVSLPDSQGAGAPRRAPVKRAPPRPRPPIPQG